MNKGVGNSLKWTRSVLNERGNVEQQIQLVEFVSDGILVAFSNGTHCYFSTQFLMSQVGVGSNQAFLTYDSAEFSHVAARPATDSLTHSQTHAQMS